MILLSSCHSLLIIDGADDVLKLLRSLIVDNLTVHILCHPLVMTSYILTVKVGSTEATDEERVLCCSLQT